MFADTITRYGLFLQKVRKNYDAAESLFKCAVHCDPTNLNALQCYAIFLEEIREDSDKAERIYALALETVQNKVWTVPDASRKASTWTKQKIQNEMEEKFKKLEAATGTAATPKQTSRSTRLSSDISRKSTDSAALDETMSESECLSAERRHMRAARRSHLRRSLSSHSIGRHGPSASSHSTRGRIDADVRFTSGQVVLEEPLGMRHDHSYVSAFHSKPWAGPMDRRAAQPPADRAAAAIAPEPSRKQHRRAACSSSACADFECRCCALRDQSCVLSAQLFCSLGTLL